MDFDNLLKIYFELNYAAKIFIDSVDLRKFESSIPRPISLEHLQSPEAQMMAEQNTFTATTGLPVPDMSALSEQLALDSTFSFLGEQIWHFIEFYNKMTQGNNFEGFSQYINMIPGLIGLDPSLPSLKKKQFTNLQNQMTRNIYQFRQIIIKAFVDTCLADLDAYRHNFRLVIQHVTAQHNDDTAAIQKYLRERIPEIQEHYDEAIETISFNHQQLKAKIGKLQESYEALSGQQCGFLSEIREGLQLRMVNDLEKFTKLFIEESMGQYFKGESDD